MSLSLPRRSAVTVACISTVAALSLVLLPSASYADDGAPPPEAVVADTTAATDAAPEPPVGPAPADAAADATPAEVSPAPEALAAEPDVAPEPAEVTVVDPADTTPEEVLASPVDAPTITVFDATADTDAEAAAAVDAPADADTAAGDVEPDAAAAALPAPGAPCYPAVCIDNGTILLAVNPTGALNTEDGTGSAAGPGDAGLEYLPTGNDATSPGCLCEGWGVADPDAGVWGGANVADDGGAGQNITVESFEWTGSTATSVSTVNDDDGVPHFRVTHEYVPAPETPNLYQVNVTIENISGEPIATVQYRRVMDWDVEPTAFDEYVTIDKGTATAVTYTSDDGFASSNPLSGPSSILGEGNMTDAGPDDHGALFDFSFGALGVGQSLSFIIFYGAAATEADAQAALAAVGAEAYSFGQTSTDPSGGTPNTFIFAFGKVGGAPIFVPQDEPAPVQPEVPAGVEPAVVGAAAPVAPVTIEAAPVAEALAATGADAASSSSGWAIGGLAALVAGAALLIARRVNARAQR
ncbi:hypothetical protein [Microbacterium sp. P02]|uniref:hypothetical protein n=1 Tax=Microbacterium sp. P02 TaxID=3366260 RepID=UPI003670D316